MAVSTQVLTRGLGESQVSGVGDYKNARVRDLIMKELSDGEKGYIVGLVDGKAWVGVNRRKLRGLKRPCYSPRIIVANTSRKAIEWLKETLGYGCVYEGKRKMNHRWKKRLSMEDWC